MLTQKKIPYKISKHLRNYLLEYEREKPMPIQYLDLTRYNSSLPLYDKDGTDTLWQTVLYSQDDMAHIYLSLKKMYAILKANGDTSIMKHLIIDRIDVCMYGNTRPFRIRIVNKLNDNFDYFYIKNADSSRVYGLELEHILSPSRMSYYVDGDTLIEEHISGIPGDRFIQHHLNDGTLNKTRLAKEFIKFNERCFIRLLGDMHSSNYVVEMMPDFEEINYRIRAIDFDQQSYDGRKQVYMPQYYKQNNPIIKLGLGAISKESEMQYRMEERALMAHRMRSYRYRIKELGDASVQDTMSTSENERELAAALSEHYQMKAFESCRNMGELLRSSLRLLLSNS
jgi:hypothetical protein